MKMGPHQLAVKELSRKDKDIELAVKKYGMPNDRITQGGFDTLLRMIIGQQISVKAANAVWRKMIKANVNTTNNILSSSDASAYCLSKISSSRTFLPIIYLLS